MNFMPITPPGIDSLLSKLRGIHPSHHKKKEFIIRQIVVVLDNWVKKNDGKKKESIVILAKALDKISKQDFYVYEEVIKRTKHPRIFQQAVNYLKWARLHVRMGGKLPFTV